MSNSDPRADAKLQNLPEAALQDLWRFRHPEEGGEKLTYEAILVEIPRLHGFSVALSTLSSFYRWLELKRRLDARADAALQLKLDMARDPKNSEDAITRAGQRLFLTEAIQERDSKAFAAIVTTRQNEKRLKQNDVRLSMDQRKLALLEKKAAQADQAAGVANNGKLSDAEKAAELKRIFRMG